MNRIKLGYLSGITLTLMVAGVVLFAVHATNAQANNPPPLSDPQANQAANEANKVETSQQALRFDTPTVASDYINTPAVPLTRASTYVALGDSVAAGLGLPLVPNATSVDTQCGRSTQGYPYIVAAKLGKTVSNFSCSGATAGDLFTQQGVSGSNISPQLSQAYANGVKPELITVTAGANDVQWSTYIQKCYVTTCGTNADTLVANGALVLLQAKLFYMFYEIQNRSGNTPPKVVLTGYYNPLSAQCTSKTPSLTANEIAWVQSDVTALNQTIQNVTSRFSFARFAPVDFTNHDLCSASPWIQGQSDAAPIHPTAVGQNAIAQSVLAAISK